MLGRVGRLLGFRWVFPIGTMPVPWHPAFLPLVLAIAGLLYLALRRRLSAALLRSTPS